MVGVGGSGCSTVENIQSSGCIGCGYIAMNTDALNLLNSKVSSKLLLGRNTTGGQSTGNSILLGEKAAREEYDRIKSLMSGADIVFITAGIGGGTGAGATPVVAEAAKSIGCVVVALVNLPFSVEGKVCASNSYSALEDLQSFCDMIVVIDNDKLVTVTQGSSIRDSFSAVNSLVLDAVRNLINVSVRNEVASRSLFTGMALIGSGEGGSAREAVESALMSPMFFRDITTASGVLLSFTAESKEPFTEMSNALDIVTSVAPKSSILWFSNISESMPDDVVRVFALVSGLEFSI
ncbi:MAG: hypothetical protein ABIH11_04575 [Candidatus Altiarchaeota archaeon]